MGDDIEVSIYITTVPSSQSFAQTFHCAHIRKINGRENNIKSSLLEPYLITENVTLLCAREIGSIKSSTHIIHISEEKEKI